MDYFVLATYCEEVGTFINATQALNEMATNDETGTRGILTKGPYGDWKINPLLTVRQKSAMQLLRIATEFGMTPSARSRIEAHNLADAARPTPEDDDDISEFLERA